MYLKDFLAVSVRGKLEVKTVSKEVRASSNGHQQIIPIGRVGKPCTKCISMISYFSTCLLWQEL